MAVVAVGALALAGCSTTQETAARLQLQSYREIASQSATVVHRASSTVVAQRVTLVRGGGRAAYVVTVHNGAGHAVSDLPISVGYVSSGHTTYANDGDTLDYFQSHLGLIAAHSTVTWLFAGGRVPAGARLFARVGDRAPANISATPATSANAWRFSVVPSRAHGGLASITNATGVPQFDLPVYVYAQRGGRVIGAGATTVATLDPGAQATVAVHAVGTFAGGQLHVEVLPADAR